MKTLGELKGQNGILRICENCIVISRQSFGGVVSHGSMGDRVVYYSDILSIEYKSPSILSNGYFKVIVGGTQDINASVGLFSSSKDSMKDPNTIVLRAFKKSTAKQYDSLYNLAMKQFNDTKSFDKR